jgi:hypothetical protein
VDEPLLAEELSRGSKDDDLIVGADLDLAADNEPASLNALAAPTDQFAREDVMHGTQARPLQCAADRCRIWAELLEKNVELVLDSGRELHMYISTCACGRS